MSEIKGLLTLGKRSTINIARLSLQTIITRFQEQAEKQLGLRGSTLVLSTSTRRPTSETKRNETKVVSATRRAARFQNSCDARAFSDARAKDSRDIHDDIFRR